MRLSHDLQLDKFCKSSSCAYIARPLDNLKNSQTSLYRLQSLYIKRA